MDSIDSKVLATYIIILVAVYFYTTLTWKLAKILANGNAGGYWIIAFLLLFMGIGIMSDGGLGGILLCAPMLVFIFIKVLRQIKDSLGQTSSRKVGGFLFGVTSSVAMFLFSNNVLGYGTTKLSLASAVVAFILGVIINVDVD